MTCCGPNGSARSSSDEAQGLDVDLDGLGDDDVVEDYLTIERVEPGELWFEGGMGPVRVPKAASDLAKPGLSASITLTKVRGRWRVVEIGIIYP